MPEFELGNPDELVTVLRNWLCQAESPLGGLLDGMDNVEWAVRQFVNYWQSPTHAAPNSVELSLQRALLLCHSGAPPTEIAREFEDARQTIDRDLKDHLGLTRWHMPQA